MVFRVQDTVYSNTWDVGRLSKSVCTKHAHCMVHGKSFAISLILNEFESNFVHVVLTHVAKQIVPPRKPSDQ